MRRPIMVVAVFMGRSESSHAAVHFFQQTTKSRSGYAGAQAYMLSYSEGTAVMFQQTAKPRSGSADAQAHIDVRFSHVT